MALPTVLARPIFKFPEEQFHTSFDGEKRTVITALDELVLTQATSPPADHLQVNAQHDLFVYADTVVIHGKLSLPGRKVVIRARVVDGNSDADQRPTIDVSGTAGGTAKPAVPKLLASPGLAGSPGEIGALGDVGAIGGTIEIFTGSFANVPRLDLIANGGQGGKGQTGQAGMDGADGADGTDASTECTTIIGGKGVCSDVGGSGGGPGMEGGNGGGGGEGGTGGAGGNIKVHAVDNDSMGILSMRALGGAGGNGGGGGNAGLGGDGGIAGSNSGAPNGAGAYSGTGGAAGAGGTAGAGGNLNVTPISSPQLLAEAVASGSGGLPGDPGVGGILGKGWWTDPGSGNARTFSPNGATAAVGKEGVPGKVTMAPRGVYDDLAKEPSSLLQLVMTLQKVRLLYLTADPDANPKAYGEVATLLLWIQNMSRSAGQAGSKQGDGKHEPDTSSALYGAATALLQRLALKRNAFGDLPSYVPQGSFAFYKTQLSKMLGTDGTFVQIEEVYTTYFTGLQQKKGTLAQLDKFESHAQSVGDRLTAQQTDARQSAEQIVKTINSDQTAIECQHQVMLEAITGLQKKMAELAGVTCVFDNLDKGLQMLAEVSGNKDVKLASTITHRVNKVLQPGISSALGIPGLPSELIVHQVDTLGAEVGTVNEGFSIGNGMVTESDPNAYKLIVVEKQLDKVLTPYLNLASARRAKDAIHLYVTLVQIRNANVLKYNGFLAELVNLQSEFDQNQVQLNEVATAIATNANPAMPALVASMARLYHHAREQVIRAIYMASRSFAYWSLKTDYSAFTEFVGLKDPSGINSGTLNAAMQLLLEDFSKAVENKGTIAQPFPEEKQQDGDPRIIFELTAKDDPGLFEAFKKGQNTGNGKRYQVSFTIHAAMSETPKAANPFFGKADVRLTKVRPWIHGAKIKEGRLTVFITHGGLELMIDPQDEVHTFTHERIHKTFEFDPGKIFDGNAQGADFKIPKQDSKFALPGPFTVWTITIDEKDNTGLDMTGVDGISFEFQGTSYSFDI